MRKVVRYTVIPSLPGRLKPLLDIAYNLWWSWNPRAVELFCGLDPALWETTSHNPVKMLGSLAPEAIEGLLNNDAYLAGMDRVAEELSRYLAHGTWYQKEHDSHLGRTIAYLSAEFGLHECLPLYSGGLGVLAGDYLKSASELGLPLIGVGLAYRFGYFRQYLNLDGWQQETYSENDFYNMPMTLVKDEAGAPVVVDVPFPGRSVFVHIWKVQVGRIPLYLLDTNIEKNSHDDRAITSHLYGGGHEMRIRQELVLGIGGIKALAAIGCPPTVTHMNEGHSAFLALERTRHLMEKHSLSFDEARGLVAATSIFTTHTAVPAGIDRFDADLVRRYLSGYCKKLGLPVETLLDLGREKPGDGGEPFSMAVLACRFASSINGVSKLHGEVSRAMWHRLWPEVPLDEIPIGHVRNGIHTPTWLSDEMVRLYDRHMGTRWRFEPENTKVWERIDKIPDAELWGSCQRLRERLVGYARLKLQEQLKEMGAHSARVAEAAESLDPAALTIGFARRFATYKRASLLMRDPDRLARIVSIPGKPVQFVFAGKAHPADEGGKRLIKEIVHLSEQEPFRNKIIFLENYDMDLARRLVQGVDVWLNTPRRPLEASGTSGMKVVANGGLTVSTLDGWWPEGYNGENGWAIGSGEEYEDGDYQDEVESLALYELLEKEVVPLFYDRGKDGLPRDWIAMMKNSIRTLSPIFNTNRMAGEYTAAMYLPALDRWKAASADGMAAAKEFTRWCAAMREQWNGVQIRDVKISGVSELGVGSELPVEVQVELGKVNPKDVAVELFHGPLNADGEIVHGKAVPLARKKASKNRHEVYTGAIRSAASGQFGFSVRVLPSHPALTHRFETGLLHWWHT
ncbi:MAG: alpha-glucan family phosphorylase [Candidatus Aureabacteria bacterium]|nr:alpha-glucan family phosphorylase [Candidatus Auribacterota bacterium]NLW94226.1 glycosyltransferase family 1 protein [Chlamydiota bacterium]HQM51575.1 alpha-glucan family phosphorylase [bacterium]